MLEDVSSSKLYFEEEIVKFVFVINMYLSAMLYFTMQNLVILCQGSMPPSLQESTNFIIQAQKVSEETKRQKLY